MTHISMLIILNLIVFSGLLITLIRYQNPSPIILNIGWNWISFTLLVWLTLSWKITEQGLALNPMGIQLALLITLRFNLILNARLLLIDMNESLLLYKHCVVCHCLKNYFTYSFLTMRYISVLGDVHKKWIWRCAHADISQNLTVEPYSLPLQRVALLIIHALVKAEKQKWR